MRSGAGTAPARAAVATLADARVLFLDGSTTNALATADKLRAGNPYLVAPVAELTQLVAEPGAADELLDPYRACGVSVTRA